MTDRAVGPGQVGDIVMDLESFDGAMLHYNRVPRHFPCGLLLSESYFRGSEAGPRSWSSVSSPLSEKTIH